VLGAYVLEDQLEELGYEPEIKLGLKGGRIVCVRHEVEVGPLAGATVRLGLNNAHLFPLLAPTGPLVSPPLLPINRFGSKHPYDKIYPADTGGLWDPEGVWQYWSRPFPDWEGSDRNAPAYMAHVRKLFATLPDDLQRSPRN
jgi:hypothetical protein